MLKYLNSPLKATGSVLMLSGLFIAVLTFKQFLFLGISVFSLGVLIQITAGLLLRSSMKSAERKWWEIILVFFILSFCAVLLLDYFGVIKIVL